MCWPRHHFIFCIELHFCYTAEKASQLVPAVAVKLLWTQYVWDVCDVACLIWTQFSYCFLFAGSYLHRACLYRLCYGAKSAQSQTRWSPKKRRTATTCDRFHWPVLHINQKAGEKLISRYTIWKQISEIYLFFFLGILGYFSSKKNTDS